MKIRKYHLRTLLRFFIISLIKTCPLGYQLIRITSKATSNHPKLDFLDVFSFIYCY